jgi:hypothetical protein
VKIDLNAIDRSLFLVEEAVILSTGEPIYFVRPNPEAKGLIWTQKNKYFRSSVWNKEGELISAGFPKFEDLNVNSENFPPPGNLDDYSIYEKMDGACLIISQYKKHTFVRTRGVLDADSSPNGKELSLFRKKILTHLYEYYYGNKSWSCSFIFEWLSQKHGLVVNYGDQPRFVLTGLVNHGDYVLTKQYDLDKFAGMTNAERPRHYTAPGSLEDLVKDVSSWNDREGVVLYSKDGQSMHRIKSNWYLALHRLRTEELCIETIIDAWFALGKMPYNEFLDSISKQFGGEFASKLTPDVSRICDAWKEVQNIVVGFSNFCKSRLFEWKQAEAEEEVYNSFGKTNRAEYVLKIYRGESLTDDNYKKLLYQCIKKGK